MKKIIIHSLEIMGLGVAACLILVGLPHVSAAAVFPPITTTIVRASDLDVGPTATAATNNSGKWFMYNDTSDTIDNTLGSFIVGPATPPFGSGSLEFTLATPPLDRKNIATFRFSGTSLSSITQMSYGAYSHSGVAGSNESPFLNFNIDFTGTSGTFQKRLVYVPSTNMASVPQDTWNTFDVINSGTAKWTWSGFVANGNKWPDNNTNEYRTWNDITTTWPSARILPVGGWLGIRVGEPGPTSYVGDVDFFTMGTASAITTYDFEPAPTTVKVTIDKLINGVIATGVMANNVSFPMSASWNATNIGSGTGSYNLSTSGFNSPNPYEAVTADMTYGASYSTNEVTMGATVGGDCSSGAPYALVGYSSGDTFSQAQSTAPSGSIPSFTNMTTNKVVLVWNKICVPAPTPLSPANGATLTTATWLTADWSDVTDPATPLTYIYESSLSSNTNPDGSFTSPAYISGPLSSSEIPTPNTPAGTYYWHVRAVDAYSNTSPWSVTFHATIDNTPAPTLLTADLVFPTPGPGATSFQVAFSQAVVQAEAEDPAHYFLANWPGAGGSGDLTGDATVVYDSGTKTATVTFTNPAWYISPEQKWGVQDIHDTTGNLLSQNPTSEYSTALVSPDAPGVPSTTPNPTTSTTQVWNWAAATDPGGVTASGISYYEYSISGTTTVPWTNIGNILTLTTSLPAGTDTLHIRAVDNAGNIGSESTGSVIVQNNVVIVVTDTTAPAVPILTSPADASFASSSSQTFDWSDVTDPSTPVVYYFQSATSSSATTTHNSLVSPSATSSALSISEFSTTGLNDGTYFWQARACDSAGNCSQWTDTHTIIIDTVAPQSLFSSPNANSVFEDNFITLAGTTTDSHGVASTTLSFASYTPANGLTPGFCGAYTDIVSLINGSHSQSFDWTYDWVPTDGVYCIKAHGQDVAGNSEASPFITNVTFKKKITTPAPTPTTPSGTATGGGNGPIVGSFGGSTGSAPSIPASASSPVATGVTQVTTTSVSPVVNENSRTGTTGGATTLATNAGLGEEATGAALTDTVSSDTPTEPTTLTADATGNNDSQAAATVLASSWLSWKNGTILFVLILIFGFLVMWYSGKKKNN